MKCYACDNETDFVCEVCAESVCENCCVQMTYYNQIDYPLCLNCNDHSQALAELDREHEWKIEEAIKIKKAAIAAKRRATYLKPENIEKRRIAKIKRQKDRAVFRLKQFGEAINIVDSMFR